MDQYVVLCYCNPNEPTIVGYIDDDRAKSGRFGLEAWPPQPGGVRSTPKKRGDRLPTQTLNCPHCDLAPALSHTTAAEVVDSIVRPSLGAGGSLRDVWGKTAIPFEDYVDDHAVNARSAELLDEWTGARDQILPSDVPTVARVAQLYVIPLLKLRELVTALSKRR